MQRWIARGVARLPLPARALSLHRCRGLAYLSRPPPPPAAEEAAPATTTASDNAATPAVRKPLFKRPAAAAAPPPADAAPAAGGGGKKPLYGLKRAPTGAAGSTAAASTSAQEEEFDLIILGGGSGGLALSKEASLLGQRVLLLDWVEPTPHGSKWGLGGTCVNVGCIPKKLMHQAAMVGEWTHDAHKFGWGIEAANTEGGSAEPSQQQQQQSDAADDASAKFLSSAPAPIRARFHWPTLVANVQQYIRSLNFGYRARVNKDANITYVNARGRLLSDNTVESIDARGGKRVFRARKHIVIATGGKPRYPTIPGAEHGITSDDLFSLPRPPGRTLIVGAGYIALESAGFLSSLGFDTTVMVRAAALRGFDQKIASLIVSYMHRRCGVEFQVGWTPTRVEKLPDGRVRVTATRKLPRKAKAASTSPVDDAASRQPKQQQHDAASDHPEFETRVDEYDTLLWAIGRDARTEGLGLESAGVATEPHVGGKVLLSDTLPLSAEQREGRDPDATSVQGVLALGDVAKNRPELTPVAIGSAKMLARRLYAPPSSATAAPSSTPPRPLQLDYASTPTTVFTPLEYGCVGWSEEEAIRRLGAEGRVEVYHSFFRPLEWALPERESDACYVKIVVERCGDEALQTRANDSSLSSRERHLAALDLARNSRVVGLHFLGPNAGEVIQGFSVAFSRGLIKADLDDAIGIHPTSAEEMLTADITKSSGEDPQKSGC